MRFMILVLLAFLILAHSAVHADSRDRSESLVKYNKDGLTLHYFFVNGSSFFEEWYKPEPPITRVTNSASPGDTISPIILYRTDAIDDHNNAFLTYDLTVIYPNGTLLRKFTDLAICREEPTDTMLLHLSAEPIAIIVDEEYPLGEYEVSVVVHDKFKQVSVPMSLSFTVKDPKPLITRLDSLSQVRTMDDYTVFYGEYYLSPRPDLVEDALVFLANSKQIKDKNVVGPMIGFFACTFAESKHSAEFWRDLAKEHPTLSELIETALSASQNLPESFTKEPLSPALNDIYWGAYFATGYTYYLRAIVNHLKFVDERKDMTQYLTGATARWSLSYNAKGRFGVREHLLFVKKDVSLDVAEIIDDLLEQDPSDLNQEMVDVLTEQRLKGIWK